MTEQHDYLATACHHGEHDYCRSRVVQRDGYAASRGDAKNPARCKFCDAPCRCSCHDDSVKTCEKYSTEYEAFFNLIAVENPGLHGRSAFVTVAWCLDDACVTEHGDWSATRSQYQDARLAGLAHCREKHVRLTNDG